MNTVLFFLFGLLLFALLGWWGLGIQAALGVIDVVLFHRILHAAHSLDEMRGWRVQWARHPLGSIAVAVVDWSRK